MYTFGPRLIILVVKSDNLDRSHPDLGWRIANNGLQNLEVCFLGPGEKYFARFQDGSYHCQAHGSFTDHMREEALGISAMTFGYGGSWVALVYNDDQRMTPVWYLNGYYKELEGKLKNYNVEELFIMVSDPS